MLCVTLSVSLAEIKSTNGNSLTFKDGVMENVPDEVFSVFFDNMNRSIVQFRFICVGNCDSYMLKLVIYRELDQGK